MSSGFDRLARPYRWMEYLTFGGALQRCRCCFLSDLDWTHDALLLGDGDGRFAASLLRHVPGVKLLALDASPAMLAALTQRGTKAGAGDRVSVQCADLTHGLPAATGSMRFDLLATHFFLDCLSEAEIEGLATQLLPFLTRDARWILSEFHVPDNALRTPARLLIRSLYLAFGILTGLKTQRMPQYGTVLEQAGFRRVRQVFHLRGLLVSEMWIPPRTSL